MNLGDFARWCVAVAACVIAIGCDAKATHVSTWNAAAAIAAHDVTLGRAFASASALRTEQGANGDAAALTPRWSEGAKAQGLTFGARVPATSTAPFDVGLATTSDVRAATQGDYVLRVRPRAIAETNRTYEDGHATYSAIAPATDLVVVADDAKFEWLYLLHDAAAPTTFEVDVELPRGLPRAVRASNGAIDFVDARGKRRLSIPVPYAVAADGARREATMTWNAAASRLAVTLDPRGLAFPILLDPSVEHPVWQLVASDTSTTPSPRYAAAMAYDAARGKSVLFGGYSQLSFFDDLADTWEWDGTTWTQALPATSPPAREYASMVYDSLHHKTLLFGGRNDATLSDLWEWDGTTWTQRSTTTGPGAGASYPMTFDATNGNVVLYDGTNTWIWDDTTWTQRAVVGPTYSDGAIFAYDAAAANCVLFTSGRTSTTTWLWDGTSWTQANPTSAPTARYGEGMVYDAALQRVILFGGDVFDTVYSAELANDLWQWDGTTWSELAPPNSPPPNAYLGMAYDSARGKIVEISGRDSTSDTWEFDGTNWIDRASVIAPPGRYQSAMAYDSSRARTTLFAGNTSSGTVLDDTWEWDGTNWLQKNPPTSPPGRRYAALAFDKLHNDTVLFGGANAEYTGDLNDTWAWNGNAWLERTPATSPSARHGMTMAYDEARHVTVLFGGCTGTYYTVTGYDADTWEWDGTTWTMRSPATSPPGRCTASMAYDSGRAVTVLFGGEGIVNPASSYPQGDFADTWEWDGTNWTARNPTTSPSLRDGAGMAYDAVRAKTVLFGGEYQSDTWEWDGTNWTSPSIANVPPRSNPTMAYDAARGTAVLFGGLSEVTSLSDTWLYYTVGAACTTSDTCDLGACTQGICCDHAQCDPCQACDLPGTEGTCTNVAAGTVPTTGAANACASPNACTAEGTCGAPLGTACAADTDCLSGFCVDGVCCDSACTDDCQACSKSRGLADDGTCSLAIIGTPARTTCANNLLCDGKGSACPANCASDAACAAGFYCNASDQCVPEKTQGSSCDDAAGQDCFVAGCRECGEGHCVGGACCSACQGTAALGATCTNDAQCLSDHCVGGLCCQSSCSIGAGTSFCQMGTCDPTANYTCKTPGTTTVCRNESCANGVHTYIATCDGKGNCGAVQTAACAPFACGETACKASCSSAADCVAGATCNTSTSTCVTGASCSADGKSVISGSTTTPCSPYLCAGDTCETQCQSISDCQTGYECTSARVCVANTVTPPAANNGCSCGIAGARAEAPSWSALAIAALGMIARGRRRRKMPAS